MFSIREQDQYVKNALDYNNGTLVRINSEF